MCKIVDTKDVAKGLKRLTAVVFLRLLLVIMHVWNAPIRNTKYEKAIYSTHKTNNMCTAARPKKENNKNVSGMPPTRNQ
jgi:hypothetical protein